MTFCDMRTAFDYESMNEFFPADQFLSWNGAHDWTLYIALCMQNEWVGSIHSQLICKIVFER